MTLFGHVSLPVELGVLIVAYIILGWDVVWQAVKNITRGQIFDEHFLMSLSTIGAFAIGEYPEAVAVMLFYQVGEFFQSLAVKRSRKSISDLMDIRPDSATVRRNGELVVVCLLYTSWPRIYECRCSSGKWSRCNVVHVQRRRKQCS